jgi:hypothetical protein
LKARRNSNAKDMLYGRLGFISLALYTTSVLSALAPFNCVSQSKKLVLLRDPSITCFGETWGSHLFFIIMFLLLYLVAVPVAISTTLFRNRKRLSNPDCISTWGFLFLPYRPAFFWWELVVILKRTGFMLISEFLGFLPAYLKVGISVIWIFAGTTFEISVQPYAKKELNLLNVSYVILFHFQFHPDS